MTLHLVPDPDAPKPHTTAEPPRRTTTHIEDYTAARWQERAACRGMPMEWWFPDTGKSTAATTLRAYAICSGCPVKAECLADCLASEDPSYRVGIFGGVSARNRRSLALKPSTIRPTCGTYAGIGSHARAHERRCDACRELDARRRREVAS